MGRTGTILLRGKGSCMDFQKTRIILQQLPLVAVDCYPPEKMTVIKELTAELQNNVQDVKVFYWSLGSKKLELLTVKDDDLLLSNVKTFNCPPQAEPIAFFLNWLSEQVDGIFIVSGIIPYISTSEKERNHRVVASIEELYHKFKPGDIRVVLMGSSIALHEDLIRLIPIINVDLPNQKQISLLIEQYLKMFAAKAKEEERKFQIKLSSDNKQALFRSALGLTLEEIKDFLFLYISELSEANKVIKISEDIIPSILEFKTRILKQTGIDLYEGNAIPVGGMPLLKAWLDQRRILFSDEAKKYQLPQPKGILLAGPPGTGKSLVAKNIRATLNIPLLRIDIAGMLGSLVGESEQNVIRALKTTEAIAPCILWFDEVEKALNQNDTSGVSQRIMGLILTFMQEQKDGVFIVATCNNIDRLPAEFKRKGRFDEIFFVDLPNLSDRAEILRIHLKRFGCEIDESLLNDIALATKGFNGAEIETLASESALRAFYCDRPCEITKDDLLAIFKEIIPLSIQDKDSVDNMREWAKTARLASPAEEDVTSQRNGIRTIRN